MVHAPDFIVAGEPDERAGGNETDAGDPNSEDHAFDNRQLTSADES